jgi:hypothetical protein
LLFSLDAFSDFFLDLLEVKEDDLVEDDPTDLDEVEREGIRLLLLLRVDILMMSVRWLFCLDVGSLKFGFNG